MVSMANTGPNSNGSQFFIATTRLPHLDGKHVVFGKVMKGLGVLRSVEHNPTDEENHPLREVLIEDCGQIQDDEDDGVAGFFKDGDMYPDYPADLDEQPPCCSWWIDAVNSSKNFGNNNYKKGDFKMALRKYRKALRYLDICWEKDGLDEDKADYLRVMKTHILTNSSACKLKLGDAKGALVDTDFATRSGIKHAKALFRRGQAYMALNDVEAAAASFERALELEPSDGAIKKELGIAKKKVAEKKDKERQVYARMFQ
ncbi:hypothetical protein KP509_27G060500 [Ceratopteris richardii]|nr:hypothetical protein KP509_27G060500 [Ceratopteris richardii]